MQQLNALLNSNSELRPLLSKAQTLSQLQQQFNNVAPAYIAEVSQVTGLLYGLLRISIANNTVAAKLRQLAPELTIALKNNGCEVSGIQVKVQVAYAPPVAQHTPRVLSSKARQALNTLSETLEDSILKQSLQRMAKQKR